MARMTNFLRQELALNSGLLVRPPRPRVDSFGEFIIQEEIKIIVSEFRDREVKGALHRKYPALSSPLMPTTKAITR